MSENEQRRTDGDCRKRRMCGRDMFRERSGIYYCYICGEWAFRL